MGLLATFERLLSGVCPGPSTEPLGHVWGVEGTISQVDMSVFDGIDMGETETDAPLVEGLEIDEVHNWELVGTQTSGGGRAGRGCLGRGSNGLRKGLLLLPGGLGRRELLVTDIETRD
jgi:hypothetical protein